MMWIILLIIILLIILLNIYAVIYVSYTDGVFEYRIKYAFVCLHSNIKSGTIKKSKKSKKSEEKPEKSGRIFHKKKKTTDVKSQNVKSQKKHRETFNDKIEKINSVVDFLSSIKKHIFRLRKKIRFSDVNIDFLIAEPDAYDCALKFGVVSASIYNIIGFISAYFKTTVKKMNIAIKYNNNKSNSRYDFGFIMKFKLGTGIVSGLGILFAYVFRDKTRSDNDDENKSRQAESKNQPESKKECLNMSDHPVNGLMGTTIEKIRDMIDVNTIIGNPITTPEGSTIIPVSKVSFGFASGGSDLPVKQQRELFGGAAGAGVSVQPLAFICVSPNGDIKLLQMSVNASKENAIINTIPELIEKISDLVTNKKEEKNKKNISSHNGSNQNKKSSSDSKDKG